MNSGHRMMRHRRALNLMNWLLPRFSPTAPGFNGVGNTNSLALGAPSTSSAPASKNTPPPPPPQSPPVANTPPPSSTTSSSPSQPPPQSQSTSTSSSSTPSSSPPISISSSSSTMTSGSSSVVSTMSLINPLTSPTYTPPATTFPAYYTPSIATSLSMSATGASSSGSSSGTSSSGVSTGALVGGIAAGILGLIGIVFAVVYFIRRFKRNNDDAAFDSDVFRRQSVMLPDDPPLIRSPSPRGYGARPPTMIQRHLENVTPVASMSAHNGYPYQQGDYTVQYNNQSGYPSSSFQPGQFVTASSPSYNHSPYGEPVMAYPYDSGHHGDLARQPSQAAYLSRQPSAPLAPVATTLRPGQDSEAHYVDLDRSSVTPFQAAQYQEISRKLDSPRLGSFPQDSQSPFADPIYPDVDPPSPARVPVLAPTLPQVTSTPLSPIGGEFNQGPPTENSPAAPVLPAAAYVPSANQKRPDTVYTLYDNEDAYGGI